MNVLGGSLHTRMPAALGGRHVEGGVNPVQSMSILHCGAGQPVGPTTHAVTPSGHVGAGPKPMQAEMLMI